MAQKIALLIGNSQYDDDQLSVLSAPWADVVALEKVLQEVGGFETIPLFNAGLIDARRAIGNLFKDRSPDDLVLLYYTGHGVRDEYGDLFLALPHTSSDQLSATSLDADFVRKSMDRSASRRQVLILDCCHSGAFMESGAKRTDAPTELNRADFVDPGGHGVFVLAAAAANQSAFEREGRSLFTRHLVDGLANGAAAPDKDEITVHDLHGYLCRGVSAEKAPMQPRLWMNQTEDLVIARNPNPRKPVPPELIEMLGDPDPYRSLGAATKLIAIYNGPDAQQAGDAETALRQRLASPEDLPLLVAEPIMAALQPESDAAGEAERLRLEAKLEETEKARIAAEEALKQAQSEDSEAKVAALEADLLEEQEARRRAETERDSMRAGPINHDTEPSTGLWAYVRSMGRLLRSPPAMPLALALTISIAYFYSEQRLRTLEAEIQRLSIKNQELLALEWLTPEETREAQELLAALGHYSGTADGVMGPRTEAAVREFQEAAGLDPDGDLDREELIALRVAARFAAQEPVSEGPGERPPLERFTDCDGCPEMIVIPGGTFMMGSPANEEGHADDEGPQHEVTLPQFALAATEVTFDQWDACVAAGDCRAIEDDEGWGRGDRPVINVSWHDAQTYIEWLNGDVAGDPYRLPSEAEWEYAARAGTQTPFFFGETISTDQANYDGDFTYAYGIKGDDRRQTVPVMELDADNAWGLRHMHGNVWEWVQDCWHDGYDGAPRDGSPWLEQNSGDCSRRVVRGGSWLVFPRNLPSANRYWFEPVYRINSFGFRPARMLLNR